MGGPETCPQRKWYLEYAESGGMARMVAGCV